MKPKLTALLSVLSVGALPVLASAPMRAQVSGAQPHDVRAHPAEQRAMKRLWRMYPCEHSGTPITAILASVEPTA